MTNNLFLGRAAVAAGAIVVSVVEYVLLHVAAGVDLAVRSANSTRQVTVAAVIVATTVAALAGWALLAVLERRTNRSRVWWTSTAVAVLLLSLVIGPPSGVGGGAKVTLALLHLSVGVILIIGLPRSRPERASR
ncbi:DUF6069 family protein [Micromonospora hortensis]|uniref:DUF6069 family protein n=1 Tax=Micromonospora hortensis TaxID=2911209 RepID=UPI001EE909A0|nr:DUF6069 family protein [Micromonospora hortensis]MCG5452235.1 DUF6069 family protein [Micromonospora hortensis]